MKINFENRDYESQVIKNTRDIEYLKKTVKPWYNYGYHINGSPSAVVYFEFSDDALMVPAGTDFGFVLTQDGNLYNITDCDSTKLYVEYWATLGLSSSDPQLI